MGESRPVLELLGTAGCHLCEEAEPLVRSAAAYLALDWRVLDIATDDGLIDRYGTRIPVLRYRTSSGEPCELGWPFGLLDILRFARTGTSADMRSSPVPGNPQCEASRSAK